MPFSPPYGLFATLGLGLVVAEAVLTGYTLRTLRRPPRRTYADAVAKNLPGDPAELAEPLDFREWTFPSRGLELPVWDIRGTRPEAPAVIVTHGWGESRVTDLPRLRGLARHFSRVISWDLPGHGASPGSCGLGVIEPRDLLALAERVGEPVVLYGFSMGAGISIAAASRVPGGIAPDGSGSEAEAASLVRGVIAEAPYRMPRTPAANVLRLVGYPSRPNLDLALAIVGWRLGVGAAFRGFDRAELARGLSVPLLVIQGEADLVCPPEDAQSIAKTAARGTYLGLPGCEHLDVWTTEPNTSAAHEAIGTWLRKLSEISRA
jgi:pimeloyl-ACP methyl ester carboxylesterase